MAVNIVRDLVAYPLLRHRLGGIFIGACDRGRRNRPLRLGVIVFTGRTLDQPSLGRFATKTKLD